MKIIYTIIAGIVLGVGVWLYTVVGFSNGTSWVTGQLNPTLDSTPYNVTTEGFDARAYFFPHPTNPKLDCALGTTSEGAGLTCFPNGN